MPWLMAKKTKKNKQTNNRGTLRRGGREWGNTTSENHRTSCWHGSDCGAWGYFYSPSYGKIGRQNSLIVRFCHRKKKNEVIVKKKELKNKGRNIFVNDDITPLRATLLKIVKEQDSVSNATTRDGRILAWLRDGNRRVEVSTPTDLHRVGVAIPDWKRLKLDHIVNQ